MVAWTYDEKGPGKPLRTLTKSPESSTKIVRLCFLAASCAANLAISPRLVLWISVFGEASRRISISNGLRILRASWYLWWFCVTNHSVRLSDGEVSASPCNLCGFSKARFRHLLANNLAISLRNPSKRTCGVEGMCSNQRSLE